MWSTLIPVLIGGALASIGSILTQWLTHRWNDLRTKRALAGAFAGEIAALCTIARQRHYLEDARLLLEYMRKSQQPTRMTVRITYDYMTIYQNNASCIGLLPPDLTQDLVKFYTQSKSLMEDVRPNSPNPETVEEAERLLNEQIELLKDTLQLGDRLSQELRKAAQ
jgi:hypothetical protein